MHQVPALDLTLPLPAGSLLAPFHYYGILSPPFQFNCLYIVNIATECSSGTGLKPNFIKNFY
ncbi:MAG TPA: hypothetical protein V6D19_02570 [Stenomitos sp.]